VTWTRAKSCSPRTSGRRECQRAAASSRAVLAVRPMTVAPAGTNKWSSWICSKRNARAVREGTVTKRFREFRERRLNGELRVPSGVAPSAQPSQPGRRTKTEKETRSPDATPICGVVDRARPRAGSRGRVSSTEKGKCSRAEPANRIFFAARTRPSADMGQRRSVHPKTPQDGQRKSTTKDKANAEPPRNSGSTPPRAAGSTIAHAMETTPSSEARKNGSHHDSPKTLLGYTRDTAPSYPRAPTANNMAWATFRKVPERLLTRVRSSHDGVLLAEAP